MGSKSPKSTDVYDSTGAGIDAILSAATSDEPTPTPRAGQLIEENERAGALNPLLGSAAGLPASTGDGFDGNLSVDHVQPATSPRESAENLLTLLTALLPVGDWQPESQAELDELVRAVERVFIYRGIAPSLPPELALVAVMGKYTRKRMAKPAVAAKVTPWLARLPLIGKLMGAPAAVPVVLPPAPAAGASPFSNLAPMSAPHDLR